MMKTRKIRNPLAWIAIGMIRAYQYLFSPWFPPACRFHPTCSAYTIEAIRHYGFLRGSIKGIWRILRCHPFARGGYDPAA